MRRSTHDGRRLTPQASRLTLALLLLLAPLALAAPEPTQVDLPTVEEPAGWVIPEALALRARVTALAPAEPTDINWRWGGEGLGGTVTRGVLGRKLALGEWSPPMAVRSLVQGAFPARLFVTFTVGRGGKLVGRGDEGWVFEGASQDVAVEFEVSLAGKALKSFRVAGPTGGTVGIVIPAYRLAGGKAPDDPEFLGELTGLREYAERRAAALEALPWARWPLPKRFAVTTNLGGYGNGSYYGVRYSDPAIVAIEVRALRQLGVNGFCSPPPFLLQQVADGKGDGVGMGRMLYTQPGGYPVGGPRDADAGCPYSPGVAERTKANVEKALALLKLPVDEVWGRTVDEIGAVVDGTPEGKAHLAACPRCAEGFREWLKGMGRAPADFGKADWAQVAPMNIWPKAGEAMPDFSTPPSALLAYYSSRFLNDSSARLFTPLRDAIARANAEKAKAMAARDSASPAARQPWLFSFALRGNTFLMGGHSLDFFDYYRHADNALVYETSNRDARIWGWDSYLCDVGRVVSERQKIRFGVYIKPHRGAPLQRMLAAAARSGRMIYWYTYGPDYSKGDSFSQSPEALALTSKAAHLLGKAEDALYGSAWARPAEVAVVSPRTSEIWMRLTGAPERLAAWENAKWTYTALAHAHVPVDAIDEEMLAKENLSRYKAIYISGPNLARAAAAKVAAWVRAGGTLYTSGWGLARDEANQPLDVLQPVLGLAKRGAPEMWYRVSLYGAGSLEAYDDTRREIAPVAAGARIAAVPEAEEKRLPAPGAPAPNAALAPKIGREVLQPAAGTQVLARFADGGAALTRHPYGKGQAFVAGFFPGLEYSAPVRAERFDMSRDFSDDARAFVAAPALAVTTPVVAAGHPLIEGILLRHPETGKRAVALMNWAYRVAGYRKAGARTSPVIGLVPLENVRVVVRGAGEVKAAASSMLDARLPVARQGNDVSILLPRLEEGDVIRLE